METNKQLQPAIPDPHRPASVAQSHSIATDKGDTRGAYRESAVNVRSDGTSHPA